MSFTKEEARRHLNHQMMVARQEATCLQKQIDLLWEVRVLAKAKYTRMTMDIAIHQLEVDLDSVTDRFRRLMDKYDLIEQR